MSLADCLRPLLASLSEDDAVADATLNKQLKLLELYIEGLASTPDKCRILLKNSGPYIELCNTTLLSVFLALGFRETEGSWVFESDTARVSAEKETLLKLIAEFRRYSLEEISQYVSRGEKPPGIRDVDDKAIEAQHSQARLVPQPRPWESTQVAAMEFEEEVPTSQ